MSARIPRLVAGALLLATAAPAAACLQQDGPAPSREAPALRVTFLDVGQADAVLIRAPGGQTALVDAGRAAPLAELSALGVERIDLLVATHPHADHIGGMAGVLEALPVRYYMDNGQTHTTATYLELMRTLRRSDVTYLAAQPRALTLGGAEIAVLPLPPAAGTDHNNRSVGLVVRFGEFRVFLSGDSEAPELTHFLAHGAVPDVTVLKAPHHGSDDAFTWPFLQAARPEVVVISLGANRYGHPHRAALAAYGATAERVLRTDQEGHVTVLGYRDGTYEVLAGGARVAAGSAAAGASGEAAASAAAGMAVRPAASALALVVFADAPGNDHRNPNGEYAVLTSRVAEAVDLAGWRLCDAARHCFTFPAGARLPAGGRVTVFTGRGGGGGASFYMGRSSAVWNNDGDTATVYDPTGAVVLRYSYDR